MVVFTLNAQGLALYSGPAGRPLNVTNPTDAQIQTFANTQYQNYVTFFNQNLGSNWMCSSDFRCTTRLQLRGDLATGVRPRQQRGLDHGRADEPGRPGGGRPRGRHPGRDLDAEISGANVTLGGRRSAEASARPARRRHLAVGPSVGEPHAAQEMALARTRRHPGPTWSSHVHGRRGLRRTAQLFVSATGDLNAMQPGRSPFRARPRT